MTLSASSRPLHDGDIVNIDITVYLNGFHGDTSQTFLVGNVVRTSSLPSLSFLLLIILHPSSNLRIQDEQGVHLVKTATNALAAGIGACGPGRAYSDIGRAIHALLVRQPFRYHVSSAFTGHGIGTVFHRPPYILHDRLFLLLILPFVA
jgi:methionyl aminopeptidase